MFLVFAAGTIWSSFAMSRRWVPRNARWSLGEVCEAGFLRHLSLPDLSSQSRSPGEHVSSFLTGRLWTDCPRGTSRYRRVRSFAAASASQIGPPLSGMERRSDIIRFRAPETWKAFFSRPAARSG